MELRFTHYRILQRLFITTVIIGLCFSSVWAQTRTVTGTVTDQEDGSAIPGVNVVLKGTFKGTSSDVNGSYSITVDDANPILVFSFVGYNPIEVVVENRSIVNISMMLSSSTLDEVVVTALGIKREEKSLGYSVAKVDGKDMNRVTTENVLNGLSGKVAGVAISSTGGTGSSVSMVIRGAKSLSSDNQPLFVIDGVPIINTLNNVSQIGGDNRVDYGNAISDLNPDNIESISILKGPSAAALYGSRAGNGVVLITTKNGSKNNKMTVNVPIRSLINLLGFWTCTQSLLLEYYLLRLQITPIQAACCILMKVLREVLAQSWIKDIMRYNGIVL
jgi:TonB-dependent SusC/RagA subfamily outer membrane receptor